MTHTNSFLVLRVNSVKCHIFPSFPQISFKFSNTDNRRRSVGEKQETVTGQNKKTNRAEHKKKRREKEKRCISASEGRREKAGNHSGGTCDRKPASRTRLEKIKQEVQEFKQNEKNWNKHDNTIKTSLRTNLIVMRMVKCIVGKGAYKLNTSI